MSSRNGGASRPRPTHPRDPWATLIEFLHDRAEWLRVSVTENEFGTYDVVLRLDGSYTLERDAREVASLMRRHLERLARQEGLELEDWWVPERRRAGSRPGRRRRSR